MRKLFLFVTILLCLTLSACGGEAVQGDVFMYEQITAETAKQIMDSGEEHIILDVREQEEFDAGHIPGAILLPYTEITA